MQDVFLDFETYYSSQFSLSKIPTQQYIESPEFEIIGVAACRDGEEPQWFSGTLEETAEWLREFDIENSRVTAHHTLFDSGILERRLGITAKQYYCTMFGAAPLVGALTKSLSLANLSKLYNIGEKGTEVVKALGKRRADFTPAELQAYAEYCRNDVALCRVIAHMQWTQLPHEELQVIDATIKKFVRPQLRVDAELLRQHMTEIEQHKQQLLEDLGMQDRKVLMSNDKFAEALRGLGVQPPTKPSPSDPSKTTYAFAKTDEAMRELCEHENPRVAALAQARLAHKSTIEETRAKRFIEATQYSGGVLCVPLRYCGAHTMRFSGASGINLQNMGRKSVLRKAIKALKHGYVVLAGDLSQIEARLVATLAGQQDLVTAFRDGRDVYCEFGSILYGREITKEDVKERFVAKCAVLMLGYGAGANKFYTTMKAYGADITQQEAERTVQVYRDTYSNIRSLWYDLNDIIGDNMLTGTPRTVGPIEFSFRKWKSPNGLHIMYPKLRRTEDGFSYKYRDREWRRLYGGALLENICQHLGRVILCRAENRMAQHGYESALSVHDELVYVVKEDKADGLSQLLETELTRPVDWLPYLPIACEVNYGESYYDCK